MPPKAIRTRPPAVPPPSPLVALAYEHLDELVLGFVQANADFTIPMCEGAVKYAEQLGLAVASTGVFTVAKVI